MSLYLVEVRRTYEWGDYYEAEDEEQAMKAAALEMQFDCIVDQQVIAKIVDPET